MRILRGRRERLRWNRGQPLSSLQVVVVETTLGLHECDLQNAVMPKELAGPPCWKIAATEDGQALLEGCNVCFLVGKDIVDDDEFRAFYAFSSRGICADPGVVVGLRVARAA